MVTSKSYWFFIFVVAIQSYAYSCEPCGASRILATIPVGNSPSGIAITPDGRFAYVANNDNAGFANGNTVSVIDLKTNKVKKTISDASFNEPYTVTINKEGTKAYVTNSGGMTITIIDIATNTVEGTITGFDGPSGFVITPDGKTAYVNNYGAMGGAESGNATTIRVVDLTTNTITGSPITVDQAPASLGIRPDGAFVYTLNYVDGNPGNGTVSVIQTRDNTVVATIPGFSGPYSIAITPDGKFAYVTNFGSNNFSPISGGISLTVSGNTVSVINLSNNTIEATITVGNQPSGVAITPDGRFVYVTNYNTFYLGANFTELTAFEGTVNIIDVCTNTVLCPVIVVGKSPSAIAISPDGTRAYVSNYTSNTVNVINIVDKTWLNS